MSGRDKQHDRQEPEMPLSEARAEADQAYADGVVDEATADAGTAEAAYDLGYEDGADDQAEIDDTNR